MLHGPQAVNLAAAAALLFALLAGLAPFRAFRGIG